MALDLAELKLTVASNLIKLRTDAGMTQVELGTKLNYSDKTISKWERGEAIPDAYVLTQLAEMFGVSVDYLLSSHTAWEAPADGRDEAETKYSVSAIIALTVVAIWTTALTIFVMLWIFDIILPQIFLLALPISLLVYMILICTFKRTRHLALVISFFVLSVLIMLYFLIPANHPWQLFIIAAPAVFIVFLSFNIKKNSGNFRLFKRKEG